MSWAEVKTILDTLQGGSQEFTANGTFTVPNLVKQIFITAVGGGGAGGHGGSYDSGNSTSKYGGGGGGGASGETIIKKCIEVSPGDTITITVGTGGIADTSIVNQVAVPGNATTVTHGDTVLTANGGAGGARGSSAATGGEGGKGQNGGRSGSDGNGSKTGGTGGAGGSSSRDNGSAGGNGGDGYVLIEWGLAAIGN